MLNNFGISITDLHPDTCQTVKNYLPEDYRLPYETITGLKIYRMTFPLMLHADTPEDIQGCTPFNNPEEMNIPYKIKYTKDNQVGPVVCLNGMYYLEAALVFYNYTGAGPLEAFTRIFKMFNNLELANDIRPGYSEYLPLTYGLQDVQTAYKAFNVHSMAVKDLDRYYNPMYKYCKLYNTLKKALTPTHFESLTRQLIPENLANDYMIF